jgi:hypothetical protein
MFRTDVRGGKDGYEWRSARSARHGRTAKRLFALHQAHHAYNLEAKFNGGFNRLYS